MHGRSLSAAQELQVPMTTANLGNFSKAWRFRVWGLGLKPRSDPTQTQHLQSQKTEPKTLNP